MLSMTKFFNVFKFFLICLQDVLSKLLSFQRIQNLIWNCLCLQCKQKCVYSRQRLWVYCVKLQLYIVANSILAFGMPCDLEAKIWLVCSHSRRVCVFHIYFKVVQMVSFFICIQIYVFICIQKVSRQLVITL